MGILTTRRLDAIRSQVLSRLPADTDAVHRPDVDRGGSPLRYGRAPPRGGRTEEGLEPESRVGRLRTRRSRWASR